MLKNALLVFKIYKNLNIFTDKVNVHNEDQSQQSDSGVLIQLLNEIIILNLEFVLLVDWSSVSTPTNNIKI